MTLARAATYGALAGAAIPVAIVAAVFAYGAARHLWTGATP